MVYGDKIVNKQEKTMITQMFIFNAKQHLMKEIDIDQFSMAELNEIYSFYSNLDDYRILYRDNKGGYYE